MGFTYDSLHPGLHNKPALRMEEFSCSKQAVAYVSWPMNIGDLRKPTTTDTCEFPHHMFLSEPLINPLECDLHFRFPSTGSLTMITLT